MSQFRRVTEQFWASPQIDRQDVAAAAARGFAMIVNNRPDGEDPSQPQSAEIAAEAAEAGLAYVEIPVTHAGFSQPQVDALIAALERAEGPVLAYCRSGTRSTLLWALAQARLGTPVEEISGAANGAGYDIGPIRQLIDMLAARPGG